jgi:hypothetical protein
MLSTATDADVILLENAKAVGLDHLHLTLAGFPSHD